MTLARAGLVAGRSVLAILNCFLVRLEAKRGWFGGAGGASSVIGVTVESGGSSPLGPACSRRDDAVGHVALWAGVSLGGVVSLEEKGKSRCIEQKWGTKRPLLAFFLFGFSFFSFDYSKIVFYFEG